MRIMTMVLALALVACGKSDKGAGGGASSDPKVTVKGFIEAMAAGDLEKAKGYLPGDGMCAKAPADQKQACLDNLKKQRDRLADIEDEWPKGATVKSVEPTGTTDMPPGFGEWKVVLVVDGKEQETGALTMEVDGKHYATFAMRGGD